LEKQKNAFIKKQKYMDQYSECSGNVALRLE